MLLPWPKVLPLVLLSIGSTSFGNIIVSFTRRPMRLDKGLYDPVLLSKGDILLQVFNQSIDKTF